MIAGLDSIPESDYEHFSEFGYSLWNLVIPIPLPIPIPAKMYFCTVLELIPGTGIDSKIQYFIMAMS